MKGTAIFKLAAMALLAGTSLVGCNLSGKQARVASASETASADKKAANYAMQSETALKSRGFADAISLAEKAVTAAPRTPDYRLILARAYFMAGRLESAETTYGDVMVLDPKNGRAGLNLALTQIALGKTQLALATLHNGRDIIAQADHGLALALAGETLPAVAMLEKAAHDVDATARVRQNLALAYALAGQWDKARAVASQDMSAEQVDQRMADWAHFVRPQNSWDQVATLMQIAPVADTGQPVALALAPAPVIDQAMAAASPEEIFAPSAIEQGLDAQPTEHVSDVVDVTPAYTPQPVIRPVTVAKVQKAALVKTRIVSSRFVVQLGAYSNQAAADIAWTKLTNKLRSAAQYTPIRSSFGTGKAKLHRIALSGFATREEASKMCGTMKAKGNPCFVRTSSGETPARWASRAAVKSKVAAKVATKSTKMALR